MGPLEEAIDKLSKEIEAKNPDTHSKDNSPFPLSAYLHLVELAPESTIYPYCRGAKLLFDWLAGKRGEEIEYPPIPHKLLSKPVPKLAQGYLTGEIAKILAGKPSSYIDFNAYLRRMTYIHKTIHYINMIGYTQDA